MSSKFIPPNPGDINFTVFIISSGSLLLIAIGHASISASSFKS